MKQQLTARPRAIAMLMAAVALPLTPVIAQEAATAPPPPVTATLPPAVQPAPAEPAPQAAPPENIPAVAPPPVASAPAEPAAEAPVQRRANRPAPLMQAARSAQRAPAATPSPSPVIQAPAADPAPVAETVTDAAPMTEQAVTEQTPPVAVTTTQETTRPASLPWEWLAAIVVGGIALVSLLLVGRRRRAVRANEDLACEPVVETAPSALVEEEQRPWIGLSINPLRAGTDGKEAFVDYELRVENAGNTPASNVVISSALVGAIGSKPIDRAAQRTVDLAPGASITIAARLSSASRKEDFLPMILAEARYPLPGGGEGHIAARFAIGIMEGDHITPIDGDEIREDVAAELDDVLERV